MRPPTPELEAANAIAGEREREREREVIKVMVECSRGVGWPLERVLYQGESG